MAAALERLRRAIEVSRRDLALGYLRQLASDPGEPSRALSFLVSDEALEGLISAHESGELSPAEYAGFAAHFARARLEHGYRAAREARVAFAERPVKLSGDTLRVGDALLEWTVSRVPARRAELFSAVDRELASLVETTLVARGRADRALSALLSRLSVPRHPDAGPEGGTKEQAERFLRDTDALMREGVNLALQKEQLTTRDGPSALWAVLGPRFFGLFPGEGRARRVALDWEPLGLRALLSAYGRVALPHAGPGVSAHVLSVNVPRDVRVVPSTLAEGLAGELSWSEGVGRALALVHASPALPLVLRQATVASVARAFGALSLLRMAEPLFLRRVRGLVRRDAEDVARASATYFLLDARLAAAAVLARSVGGSEATARAAELGVRALTASLPEATAAWLVLRLSPGGAFRGKSHALGLAWALRERFDEDWFLNPRASEPLRGAMARAGDFSIEAFADELGAQNEEGLRKLSELF